MTAQFWKVATISGGWMSVDGGTLFGIVPKTMWGKLVRADHRNLVRIPCRCLLARRGKEVLLIDSGYGGKQKKSERRSYELEEGNPILDSLAKVGVQPEDVTDLVLTHLHFDHAGGATRYDEKETLLPTFPNARCWASRIEWREAVSPASALRNAYPQENLTPLIDKKLNRSFEDDEEILPGLTMLVTGGHTRGHAAARLQTDQGPILFIGELAPTRFHAKQLWTSAFDTHMLQTRLRKPKIFARALEEGVPIYWPHDPDVIVSRLVGRKQDDFFTEKLM
ncbi:MAG: MBL fold metallo-hydrolase [Thermoguttaceae bacterium]|jgi:glyoxylase-like metal-dependent hydrolase (beta-lactamase superfamily II)